MRPNRKSARGDDGACVTLCIARGKKPRSKKAHGGIRRNNPAKPRACRRAPCGVGVPERVVSGLRVRGKTLRGAASERAYGTGRGAKPRRVKPHEWYRDGTSPEGHEGSKASRGCETLRAQQNRRVGICRGYVAPYDRKTLKGKKPRKGPTSAISLEITSLAGGDVRVKL